MALNLNIPRQARQKPLTAPAVGRYSLTRQAPLTQGAQLSEDQNNQGLSTGKFGDVESARAATDRANALRTSQGLQAARGTIARAGGDFSPEAALRAQDQAFAAADGQNLNASNSVNQLQRQYRTDAQNRAADTEAAAQLAANNERSYQTGRDDTQYGRNTDEARYGDTRSDVLYNQGEDKRRFDTSFGANREDAATAKDQFSKTFGANREDAATAKNQFGETLAQRQQEFGVSSGQSQQQINNQQGQFLQSLGQRDKEFGVTAGQSQQGIDNQKEQFGQTLKDSRSRFDLARGDSNAQFDQTFGANREDAATAKDQFGQTLNQRDKEFGVSSGQNQQQINNQASQFGQTFGANREDAATAKDQFSQTFGANREDAATAKDQFGQTLQNNKDQFGVTAGQNQQQINNQQGQFAQTLGDSRSRFDLTREDANAQQDVNNERYDQTYADQRGDINYDRENANRLEGKGDSLAAINNIQDPKARQAAYNAYMNGEDVSKFITGTLYDSTGGLAGGTDSPYASASPGTQAYQAKVDELKSYNPIQSGEAKDKYEARIAGMAQTERNQEREVTTGPVKDAALERSIATKKSSGQPLTAEETAFGVSKGLVNTYTAKNLPTNTSANALKGQQVNVDGQVYTVVGGSNAITGSTGTFGNFDTHTDYAILEKDGKRVYVVNGKIQDNEPKDKG